MTDNILVLYGSYRSDRLGIRLANYIVTSLRQRGNDAELIDAKDVGLPMLDRMYKEYPKGSAPRKWRGLPQKFAEPMHLFSSQANTTGACNPV